MLKILVPGAMAAMLAAAAFMPATATAAPATSLLPQLESTNPDNIQQVRFGGHRGHARGRGRGHRGRGHFRAGGRYRSAPAHWHRFHRRPVGWLGRGCIVVGPAWFCP